MPDDTRLLDAEMRAYLARIEALSEPDGPPQDIAGKRRAYDAMCAQFDRGRPDGVAVADELHGGVPCRRYECGAPEATVLYVHGGGFVLGGLETHDSICAEICARTGLRVVAVDYPLAPEHPYPADHLAVWTAFGAVSERFPGPLVLCGDSAGGTLCGGVAHRARDAARDAGATSGRAPAGQVLMYPALGFDWSLPSYSDHAEAPQLTTRDMKAYVDFRSDGVPPDDDPYFAPLHDNDFAGLPPTVCITAEFDPLTSDSAVYVERITAAGGRAAWVNETGLVHGFLRARGMSRLAAESFDRLCRSLGGLARGDWPVI